MFTFNQKVCNRLRYDIIFKCKNNNYAIIMKKNKPFNRLVVLKIIENQNSDSKYIITTTPI